MFRKKKKKEGEREGGEGGGKGEAGERDSQACHYLVALQAQEEER